MTITRRWIAARRSRAVVRVLAVSVALGTAAAMPRAAARATDAPNRTYAATWDSLGAGYKDSMPIGNGDLGLNVWTEANGDLVLLVDKTDAWTENSELVKLGRVRVALTPNPFTGAGAGFHQVLDPIDGEIRLTGHDGAAVRVWVDANAPVAHVEIASGTPLSLGATTELWRTEPRRVLQSASELQTGLREVSGGPDGGVTIDPDTILPAEHDRVAWAHHNARSIYASVFENQHLQPLLAEYPDPLMDRTFGAVMKGPGLDATGKLSLASRAPATHLRLDLYALTERADTVDAWRRDIDALVARTDAVNLDKARAATRAWWRAFWDRSWIDVSGDADADNVTQGYAMQRWMTAAQGRGAAPMKFNGGIFTVGQEPPPGTPYDPAKGEHNADFRAWGSNYWFQNQRLVYWPMIADGDVDTLAPFFKMYADAQPLATDRVALDYKHGGAVFPETMFFWGLPNNVDFGWGNPGVDLQSRWIRYHVNNGLELTAMMLDTYAITRDDAFARTTLVPLATAITTYFNEHWPRVDGKIRFDPSAAIETRQMAVNPAPDIAGLMSVVPRLLALPQTLTTPAARAMWAQLVADLPPLPRGHTDAKGKQPQTPDQADPNGREILWAADSFSKPGNSENPELYAVFPYGLFGVNLPDLDLARATYDARIFKGSTCWGQDGVESADLGWADRAKAEVIANFTAYGGERFKWFWRQGHDWEPDLDNGGAGQLALQAMLLQVRGDKILLFPAWPKAWNVDFKLHAPDDTVVRGIYRNGRLETLDITPRRRAKDVIVMMPR